MHVPQTQVANAFFFFFYQAAGQNITEQLQRRQVCRTSSNTCLKELTEVDYSASLRGVLLCHEALNVVSKALRS